MSIKGSAKSQPHPYRGRGESSSSSTINAAQIAAIATQHLESKSAFSSIKLPEKDTIAEAEIFVAVIVKHEVSTYNELRHRLCVEY